MQYRPPSESRRPKFWQTSDDDHDRCIDDSDHGQGRCSSGSVAGPWEDVEKGSHGQETMEEDCRRVGGFEQQGRTDIGTPMASNNGDGHDLWCIGEQMEGTHNAPNIVATRLP